MRSRTTKYLLIGYVVKTLLFGIVWLFVPEWRNWVRASAAPMLTLVGCKGAAEPERSPSSR